MKVKELIEKLKDLDQEKEITIDYDCTLCEIVEIIESKNDPDIWPNTDVYVIN